MSLFGFSTAAAGRPMIEQDGLLWLAPGSDPATAIPSAEEAESLITRTMAASSPTSAYAERSAYEIRDEPDREAVRRPGRRTVWLIGQRVQGGWDVRVVKCGEVKLASPD